MFNFKEGTSLQESLRRDIRKIKMYSSFHEPKKKFNAKSAPQSTEKRHLTFYEPTFVQPFSFLRDLTAAQKDCIHKFINLCMIDGKKNKSQKIISKTLSQLAGYGDVLAFLVKAIDNVKPIIEVRRIRIAGSTQLVPCIISRNRQESLGIRWIVEAAMLRRNTKKNMSLDQCLVAELIDAYHKNGTVRKKRDDLHKLAEANRGFAHYRWW